MGSAEARIRNRTGPRDRPSFGHIFGDPPLKEAHTSTHHRDRVTQPSEDAVREVIERYLAAYNAFDIPGMLTLLHPDVAFENVAGGQVTASTRGRDEFRALAEHGASLFTSRRQRIREYRATPAGADVEIEYEGVLAVELSPELPAGATLRLAGRSIFEMQDGRIVRLVDES